MEKSVLVLFEINIVYNFCIFHMKTELTILILFIILTSIGGLVLTYNKGESLKRIGKGIGSIAFILLLFFLIPFRSYDRWTDQDFAAKHHLPQIDSSMVLQTASKLVAVYKSWSLDSIRHSEKVIMFDIFGISKITDEVLNEKTNTVLQSIFITKGLLRDSARIYTKANWDFRFSGIVDTITSEEFNQAIKDWGLAEKLYKRESSIRNSP